MIRLIPAIAGIAGLLTLLAPARPAEARTSREEVRIGLEREIGADLVRRALLELWLPVCSDPGWVEAAPPDLPPAYRAAYPRTLRVEPRPCRPAPIDR